MAASSNHGWAGEGNWPGNPFVHYVSFDTLDKIRIAFMTIFVMPVRLVLMSAAMLTAYLLSIIAMVNRDELSDSQPLRGWRKKTKDVCNKFYILAHMVCGIHRITVRGKPAEPWEAPIMVFGPHSCMFDPLPVAIAGAPSIVGKVGLHKIPFLGTILLVTQPLFVNRDCKDSRKSTVQRIRERARLLLENKDHPDGIGWPQIAIFPEATCTNRSRLLNFKPGAFLSQLPVQPVCIRWPDIPDTVSWTWEGLGFLKTAWLTLCRFETRLELDFLPVYVPNDQEKNDPALFARNVRAKMAECLNLPVCEYSLEDARYLTRSYSPNRSDFLHLCDEFRISYAICDDLELDKTWCRLKHSQWSKQGYKITYDQFVHDFIHLPTFAKLRHLFNIFDWTCAGEIDLREFIIAQYANIYTYNSMKLCFEMFQDQHTGEITREGLVSIVRMPYGMSLNQCKKLYAILMKEASEDGSHISIDTLQKVAKIYDEYAEIFRFERNNNC